MDSSLLPRVISTISRATLDARWHDRLDLVPFWNTCHLTRELETNRPAKRVSYTDRTIKSKRVDQVRRTKVAHIESTVDRQRRPLPAPHFPRLNGGYDDHDQHQQHQHDRVDLIPSPSDTRQHRRGAETLADNEVVGQNQHGDAQEEEVESNQNHVRSRQDLYAIRARCDHRNQRAPEAQDGDNVDEPEEARIPLAYRLQGARRWPSGVGGRVGVGRRLGDGKQAYAVRVGPVVRSPLHFGSAFQRDGQTQRVVRVDREAVVVVEPKGGSQAEQA